MSEIKKPVIVVGKMSGAEVAAQLIRGLKNVTKVIERVGGYYFLGETNPVIERRDKKLRTELAELACSGKSVLIVGDKGSGKTELLTYLIRCKAKSDKGLLVIAGIDNDAVWEADGLLTQNGIRLNEDMDVLATYEGFHADTAFMDILDDSESAFGLLASIDIVVKVDEGVITNMFENRQEEGSELRVLVPMDGADELEYEKEKQDPKAMEVIWDEISDGNGVYIVGGDKNGRFGLMRELLSEVKGTEFMTLLGDESNLTRIKSWELGEVKPYTIPNSSQDTMWLMAALNMAESRMSFLEVDERVASPMMESWSRGEKGFATSDATTAEEAMERLVDMLSGGDDSLRGTKSNGIISRIGAVVVLKGKKVVEVWTPYMSVDGKVIMDDMYKA
ncbi:ATP-binding protein [Bacillus paranthracis]|uniref:ATP-binding protein n=1 Tax=Bacillus paranthracis TaxID=2026186 RepID=UPI0018792E30|nr:ATP-binding protein [Bacillus paranthracis]MBE7114521.1 ATP-binding protein [Bacillus paranthracis]MBE7154605.1 ATP-binding protein [Bacillus paranthracis]